MRKSLTYIKDSSDSLGKFSWRYNFNTDADVAQHQVGLEVLKKDLGAIE